MSAWRIFSAWATISSTAGRQLGAGLVEALRSRLVRTRACPVGPTNCSMIPSRFLRRLYSSSKLERMPEPN